MTPQGICDLLAEEIGRWLDRQRSERQGATRAMLLDHLASELGVDRRQIYRYMSGDTPFPLAKLLTLCHVFGSARILETLLREAPKLDATRITGFDLVVEQARSMKEFGEFAAAYAEGIERAVSVEEYERLHKEAREAIQQIDRIDRIYGAMVEAKKQGSPRP